MKFFLCFSFLFAYCFIAYSQSQSLRTEEYCEVEVIWVSTARCHVRVDFGQPVGRGLLGLVDKLRDPLTQQPMEFNSPVNALNYMNEQGWELVQAYSSDSCDTRYIMRRLLVSSTSYETVPR
jgi:hypothetical protein